MTSNFNQAAHSTVQIICNIIKKRYLVKWSGGLSNISFLKILISQKFNGFQSIVSEKNQVEIFTHFTMLEGVYHI